ncbi:hypothetical protein BGZ58_003730 [Dissophora ornata]|nr:hypothetical protein BGZ58_003730 [Dissophora ornata]
MDAEFDRLLSTEWAFLRKDWPVVKHTRFHRTEIKEVHDMRKVKDFVLQRLGTIPVFFFLAVVFGKRGAYPGPYRNVEKGLLILYMLLKGLAVSDIGEFMPKSSFHDVFKDFFSRGQHVLDAQLTTCLAGMCSSLRLRLLTARSINPVGFKHITLHLDGHDSRVVYPRAEKASMYSYKLKKSGFRTQLCCDMNSMIVFVSQPAECRDFNDGTMLSRMAIQKKIDKLDCVAVDGGYTQHLAGIVNSSELLTPKNFTSPIRKPRGIELTVDEKRHNETFGNFRSTIESYFGDMQNTFSKFSHATVNRVSDKGIFALQYKLACLLLNIKRMVALRGIDSAPHHNMWMQDEFEYPDGSEPSSVQSTSPSLKARINDAQSLALLQAAFLNLAAADVAAPDSDLDMGDDDIDQTDAETVFEVQKILGHRGEGEAIEYHVLWKGYDASYASWEPLSSFNETRIIEEYQNSQRDFG